MRLSDSGFGPGATPALVKLPRGPAGHAALLRDRWQRGAGWRLSQLGLIKPGTWRRRAIAAGATSAWRRPARMRPASTERARARSSAIGLGLGGATSTTSTSPVPAPVRSTACRRQHDGGDAEPDAQRRRAEQAHQKPVGRHGAHQKWAVRPPRSLEGVGGVKASVEHAGGGLGGRPPRSQQSVRQPRGVGIGDVVDLDRTGSAPRRSPRSGRPLAHDGVHHGRGGLPRGCRPR